MNSSGRVAKRGRDEAGLDVGEHQHDEGPAESLPRHPYTPALITLTPNHLLHMACFSHHSLCHTGPMPTPTPTRLRRPRLPAPTEGWKTFGICCRLEEPTLPPTRAPFPLSNARRRDVPLQTYDWVLAHEMYAEYLY
jgi:hypothetical protein